MLLYKLMAELYGHSKDVRGVAEGYFPTENTIVSCSRDESIRIWQNDESGCYTERHRLQAHSGFAATVTGSKPTAEYPEGLIFSGGRDRKINVFIAGPEPKSIFTLDGHTDTVCALALDETQEILVSGSWDATARVWKGRECIGVLAGHSHTVWAVAIVPFSTIKHPEKAESALPCILTGSADKKIILWTNGKPERTFQGHTDCVRALAILSDSEFLSASNDCTIRRWNMYTGECVMVYCGHESFIYSMAIVTTDKDIFVTVSEDSTAKLWKTSTGENFQTLLFPTSTIWAVCSLSNGDIAIGSSDGVVRIFSSDPKRQADPESLLAYDQSVQIYIDSLQSKETIGGYKIADLPGTEILNERGTKDGQTKMVRNGKTIELYKWTEEKGEWEKVGDVMGAANEEPVEGKMIYNGKEYDYVFDIDVDDSRPPLKLPYNITEDPWTAAQRFLEENMLPSTYIDQVVQFILTNAPNAGRDAPRAALSDPFTGEGRYVPGGPMETSGAGMSDPFTGGGRYVPGSTRSNGAHTSSAGDPFTASGRYVPARDSSAGPPGDPKNLDPRKPRGEHMPLVDYIQFTSVSADSLLAKLMEFNQKQQNSATHLSEENIVLLEEFTRLERDVKYSDSHLKALERALQWHKDYLVPVLDIFRLAILNNSVNSYFFTNSNTRSRGLEMVDNLCRLIAAVDSPPQFQILVCRSFANAIAGGECGRRLITSQECSQIVIPLIVHCLDSSKAAAQIAAASALANFSCAYVLDIMRGVADTASTKIDSFRWLVENVKLARKGVDYGSMEQEAIFRILQALVTFMWGDDATLAVGRALNISDLVVRLKDATNEERNKAIARSIERMIGLF